MNQAEVTQVRHLEASAEYESWVYHVITLYGLVESVLKLRFNVVKGWKRQKEEVKACQFGLFCNSQNNGLQWINLRI